MGVKLQCLYCRVWSLPVQRSCVRFNFLSLGTHHISSVHHTTTNILVGLFVTTMPRSHSNRSRPTRRTVTRRSPRRRTYKGVDARLYGTQTESRPGPNPMISLLYKQFTYALAQLTKNLGGVIESRSGSGLLSNAFTDAFIDPWITSNAATDPKAQLKEIISINIQTFFALASQLATSGLPEDQVVPALTYIAALLAIRDQAVELQP